MIRRISHIGVAVTDLEAARTLFEKILGISPGDAERIEDQKVDVVPFRIGETNVEFTGAIAEDSPIAAFLRKRGTGMHHLAFEVDDLQEELGRMRELGIRLIDEKPRKGAGGNLIAFLHPSSTGGILIELCQKENND